MESYFLQAENRSIHCCKWLPEEQPKAIVQIVHGIAEHILRYDHFATFLTAHGYAVVAEDHMGHGGTLAKDDVRGYFEGGWMQAVANVKRLHDHTVEEHPGLPYYFLGHSMGSFLLRTYLYTYPDALDGAILSGTGWESAATLRAGLALCKLEQLRLGEKKVSPLLNDIMFGTYNRAFRPNRTTHDWVCSVDSVVDAYLADPLCGFDATVGLARDMLTGIRMNEQPENLQAMNQALPVLFISGVQDPVGHMAKGVLHCIDAFKRAGLRDVTIRIYPKARHEILNEFNRDEVYADVLLWLESR